MPENGKSSQVTPKPDWQTPDGCCKFYCADCLDVLPVLGSVDAVVTDPPYGINHKSHGQRFVRATSIEGDHSLELAEEVRQWAEARGIACAMFFSPYNPMSGWRSVLCWIKGEHVGIGGDRATCWKRDFELIGIERNDPLNGQRDSAVLEFPALSPPPSGHFAEKPTALMNYLVGKLPADCILDPFMGSGTTGVACVQLGRKFIGIEKERRYFDVAVGRIQKELERVSGGFGLLKRSPKSIRGGFGL